jgi:uncharacterized membrane protein YgcG
MSIKPTNYVNDYEELFTLSEETKLNGILKYYQDVTSIEIYVVTTSQIFDSESEIDNFALRLGVEWGVGSSELNNGMILLISVASRKWSIKTGYGVEILYPDDISKRYSNKYLKQNFRDGNYAIGVVDFLKATTNYIGYEGLEQLIEKQEIANAESKARAKQIGVYFLIFICGIVVIILLVYLIKVMLKKRKEYLGMSDKITHIHNDIMVRKDNLLKMLGYIPQDLEKLYNKIETNNVKIDADTYNRLFAVKDAFREHQDLIYNTNNIINIILPEESEVKKYLSNTYDYCGDYFKEELKKFLPDTTQEIFTSTDFSKDRYFKLKNLNNNLGIQISKFLKKTYNIGSIASASDNLDNKIEELKKSYVAYKKGKLNLMSLPIGDRLSNLAKVDIDKYISDVNDELKVSFDALTNDDYKIANYHYGIYLTLLSVLNSSFSSVTNLISSHKKSKNYIEQHKDDYINKLNDVNDIINKSSVKNSRKYKLREIDGNIKRFNNNLEFDVILSASLLKEIIEDLDTLQYNIKGDIKKKNAAVKRAVAASP